MDYFDDRIGVVGLDRPVVVELDMLIVCGRQNMKIMIDEAGTMVEIDSMDVREIVGIMNGEDDVDVVKVVDGDMKDFTGKKDWASRSGIEADGNREQKTIHEWLTVTSSRNAKWWCSTFHNITAMVGISVLNLPYAMSHLG
ncbi:hypothetical protein H5410_005619 [Solanum commersonii]|uniref:Uncharacterized protein n=1 Tax=Solanum commersonii TaxID=4109 RepID=A0A9J6A796_SOLCO|nr:hypothetical protein H5410_005619 [Solanum commersonii]